MLCLLGHNLSPSAFRMLLPNKQSEDKESGAPGVGKAAGDCSGTPDRCRPRKARPSSVRLSLSWINYQIDSAQAFSAVVLSSNSLTESEMSYPPSQQA
jgi:hypothetical protein